MTSATPSVTTVRAFNDVSDFANNSAFFFLVPPGAQVESGGLFVAHDQYPPYFHVDKHGNETREDIPVGVHDVYCTWDDVGAHKYEILAKITYDFVYLAPEGETTWMHWVILKQLHSHAFEIWTEVAGVTPTA
jgi:hypothetical protein